MITDVKHIHVAKYAYILFLNFLIIRPPQAGNLGRNVLHQACRACFHHAVIS